MFWEKNPLNCASPGRSITGPEAVAEVAAMIEAGQVAPPAPVTPEVKAKGGVKAKAVAPPKATPKVPSKAAGVSAPVYEARFVRGQWFLCQINPNTGVESLQPLDPSDYFPEPSGHAEEVPGQTPLCFMMRLGQTFSRRARSMTIGTQMARWCQWHPEFQPSFPDRGWMMPKMSRNMRVPVKLLILFRFGML